MASLHNIDSTGILEGHGNVRPDENRVFIPFPEGITQQETLMVRKIELVLSVRDGDSDIMGAGGEINDDVLLLNYVEEIGGQFYIRMMDTIPVDLAERVKNRLVQAVKIMRENSITTQDQVMELLAEGPGPNDSIN